MYLTHWGLMKPPFPSGLDPHLFHEGMSQRESLARLRFVVAHRRRLGLVAGDVGLGKSLLLDVFAEQSREAGHAVAKIFPCGMSAREFYWQLGSLLQARVRVDDDLVRLFRQTTDRIDENRLEGQQTILLLDDLDQSGPDLQNQILRLLRVEAANAGWLTVVASANVQQLARLTKPLLQLCDLQTELEPWDELDTVGYLQMALLSAGAERPLFEEEAISELHRLAGGVPRDVNRLADLALLAGANTGSPIIGSDTLREVGEAATAVSLA